MFQTQCKALGGRISLLSKYCSSVKDTDIYGLPKWLSGKEATSQCWSHRRCEFDPWVRKNP